MKISQSGRIWPDSDFKLPFCKTQVYSVPKIRIKYTKFIKMGMTANRYNALTWPQGTVCATTKKSGSCTLKIAV